MNKRLKEFDDWWYGSYGEYSIRAEHPANMSEAAYMAWTAQQEVIDKLKEDLEYHKTAILQLLECFEYIAGDCEDDNQAERELYAVDYARDTLTGNENK